jgi:phosphoserine phosphatase
MSVAMREAEEFFDALDRHPVDALLIVDFDETLWLRNSTEMFLDSVRPRFLAAIVLQLLGALRPWRLLRNGNAYRDWIRVMAVLIVAPWSLWQWRRQAELLGPRYVNQALLQAIKARPERRVAVVSFGFREIVRPLLSAISTGLRLDESCSLRSGARLRVEGKAWAVERQFGPGELAHALAVTDSVADSDLLAASAGGFLVEWEGAHYQQAGLKPLMPFVYLQRVKRPDENYLRNAILGHDVPVLILAFALISSNPLLASASILLYVLAFFTFYEIGYHENDRLGLKLEARPKVWPAYDKLACNFSPAFAASVAVGISGFASLLAAQSLSWIPGALGFSGLPAFFAVWGSFLAFLLVIRLIFRWQNVIEPQGRIVPMLGLQIGRVLGYAIIFPTSVIGALFCIAHGVSRWLPYVVYRFGGDRRDVPNHLVAFLLLLLLAGATTIGGSADEVVGWQALLILAYSAVRAAKDLLRFHSVLRPISIERRECVCASEASPRTVEAINEGIQLTVQCDRHERIPDRPSPLS